MAKTKEMSINVARIGYAFVCLLLMSCYSHAQNLALKLDGEDNNVRTGIGFIEAPWTLEAWIKGDDREWKQQEVLFGGGEYSTYSQADNLPLVLADGKLCSVKAGMVSGTVLDDQWHHVALTCDGERMCLYLDSACCPSACRLWAGGIPGITLYAGERIYRYVQEHS